MPGSVAIAIFLMVAEDRRAGPPPIVGGRSRPEADQSFWAPVGVRHAVNRVTAWTQSPQRTLCGKDATGWHDFPGLALTGEHGADCHRCLQLIGAEPEQG